MPESHELDFSQFDLPTLRLIDKALKMETPNTRFQKLCLQEIISLGCHSFFEWHVMGEHLYAREGDALNNTVYEILPNGERKNLFQLNREDSWIPSTNGHFYTNEPFYYEHEIHFVDSSGQVKKLGRTEKMSREKRSGENGFYVQYNTNRENQLIKYDESGQKIIIFDDFHHLDFAKTEKGFFIVDDIPRDERITYNEKNFSFISDDGKTKLDLGVHESWQYYFGPDRIYICKHWEDGCLYALSPDGKQEKLIVDLEKHHKIGPTRIGSRGVYVAVRAKVGTCDYNVYLFEFKE